MSLQMGWVSIASVALTLAACDAPSMGAVAGPRADGEVVRPDGGTTGPVGQCTGVGAADDDCAEELGCVDGRCACTSDERCQVGDLWRDEGCASDADCTDTFVAPRCVQWDGTTYCVSDDTDAFGCGLSDPRTKVEVTLADGSGTIQTCVDTTIECMDDGTCGVFSRCEDDGDCSSSTSRGRSHCDVASGRCVCTEDPEDSCTANHPAFQCRADGECGCLEDDICPSETGGHCDITTGECGCLATADCPPGEVCHEGQCRCTSATGCGVFVSPTNPGTTLECLPL